MATPTELLELLKLFGMNPRAEQAGTVAIGGGQRRVVTPTAPSGAPVMLPAQEGLASLARRVQAAKPLPARDISSNIRGAKQIQAAQKRRQTLKETGDE